MANHHCKPRWAVADMAFFTPDWRTFWITNGVQMLPTGARTPWPNVLRQQSDYLSSNLRRYVKRQGLIKPWLLSSLVML
eukprot:791573-Amphidinium_carterae.1